MLPFVNRSRDEEDEYFADGLADELLNVLAKIRGLRVAARTSSFQFKGKSEDLAVIGRKLNVATLLEGSVRKAGSRVRIAVQLVKVADGFQLWSETYDRTLEDIFAVQDDIAQSVVKELRTALLGEAPGSKASGEVRAEVAAAAKGRGTDAEAHRLFLQGRYLVNRLASQDVAAGIDYLQRAIAAGPRPCARLGGPVVGPGPGIRHGLHARRRGDEPGPGGGRAGRWRWSPTWPRGTWPSGPSSSGTTGTGRAPRPRTAARSSWRPATSRCCGRPASSPISSTGWTKRWRSAGARSSRIR